MKRAVPENQSGTSKIKSQDGPKRPRGRPSKSDLFKEEVQKNKDTGAQTIFGCFTKKESDETKSTVLPSSAVKSSSLALSSVKIEPGVHLDAIEPSSYSTVEDCLDKPEKHHLSPESERSKCQEKVANKQQNAASNDFSPSALFQKPVYVTESISRQEAAPNKNIMEFEDKDFLELKRINEKVVSELTTSKATIIQLNSEIKKLQDCVQEIRSRKSEYCTKIASLNKIIQGQRSEIELKSEIIENLKHDLSECKEKINFYTEQPAHVHELIRMQEKLSKKDPLRWGILYSFIMNNDRNSNLYTTEERDFWIDRYNHSSNSEFDNLSSNLNGPRRSTVQKWIGPRQSVEFGLSAERLLAASNFYQNMQNTTQTISDEWGLDITALDMARIETLQWASTMPDTNQDIENVELLTCMIDETATRIIIQYNHEDDKLYGWSAMPRFVILRNLPPDFNFKTFFSDFTFQYDKKKKCDNFSIHQITGDNDEAYSIGVCQFEQYSDFYRALDLSGKEGIIIEAITPFPDVKENDRQKSIDKEFAEAEAIGRPRATYIYSLAVNSACSDKKVTEVSTITTNNRFLQNQDHCLATYNLMKMANYLKLPIIQFVADGDSRFRLQMMLMGAYDLKNEDNFQISGNSLERNADALAHDGRVSGWEIRRPSKSDMFNFIATAEELQIADFVSNAVKKDPHEPFNPDPDTTVHFYLFIRVLSDVFRMLAPFLGGIPRSPCQDQCHWLRKMVKISPLSTKLLFLGNYPALFSHVAQVYDLGPEYGLLKSDIDIHNKSDQKSAERLISGDVLAGLNTIPWSEGTAALILIGKRGFEAWWRTDLTVIDRLCNVYFVSKVLQLWREYQELAGFDLKETFISQELYRDTLIMCSSLPQLAVAFKLFFPSKPLLPWRFSEYPLENYYSEIRGMFGNADEFSVLEYVSRKKRVDAQQDVLQRGLVNRERRKMHKSRWHHPKNPTPDAFPHLFDNSWGLAELLEKVYREDLRIIKLFSDLGMSELLHGAPLFMAKTPRERTAPYITNIDPNDEDLLQSVLSDIFNGNNAFNDEHIPCQF